ncbi:putative membrane protein [Photobacterium leiognathi lrivu.4.1]|uniref:Putative membrane protein n=1 Tax=Photobacterium leiognathi lrivu.4.1 TaxID=1248232 RepID=V5H586_PHOLE|nr:putative membrane protein [Photobacterium leiognathi lrivu.4.1]
MSPILLSLNMVTAGVKVFGICVAFALCPTKQKHKMDKLMN